MTNPHRFIVSTPRRLLLLLLPFFVNLNDRQSGFCRAFSLHHNHRHVQHFAARLLPNRCLVSPYSVVCSASRGNEEEEEVRQSNRRRAREWGERFVESIMNPKIETIPNSGGMRIVRNVVKLERGNPRDIILRNITEPFWQACIDVVNTPNNLLRVAAVGTPGIGKTTLTPWLIRMLLMQGETVVYLIRTEDESGCYYEFIPNSDGTVTTNVYPEKIVVNLIPSLRLPSSYYIVDPGRTQGDCVPADTFEVKFILVSPPDSGHWGGSEFEKRRDDVCGRFLYFPTWSYEELLFAQPILCPALTDDQVRDRYFQFGGVPRHIFEPEKDIKSLLKAQNRALKAISGEIAADIVLGEEEAIDAFGEATKSAVLAFRLSAEDNGTFRDGQSYIVSELVSEKIYARFQDSLWNFMWDRRSTGGDGILFKMITRHMIASGKPPFEFECRPCVDQEDMEYKNTCMRSLGTGDKDIRQVMDPIEAAKTRANVVFYPIISRDDEVFDFVYKDSHDHFHVFQTSLSAEHTASVASIKRLEKEVGDATKVSLYFLVPSTIFPKFVTKAAKPLFVACKLFHVSIPNPKLLKKKIEEEIEDEIDEGEQ